MRVILKKLGVLFALLLITPQSFLFASENANASTPSSEVPKQMNIDSRFILEGKKLLDPRVINKIDEMGNELFEKSGVNVYIYAKRGFLTHELKDRKERIAFVKNVESNIIKDLKDPYVVITIALNDVHVNLLESESLKSVVDKNKILDDFIIPVLASKDQNSLYNKASLALLNGYGEVVDNVAESRGFELKSSIESGSTEFKAIWRVFMYFLVVFGLLAYVYAVLKSKKS